MTDLPINSIPHCISYLIRRESAESNTVEFIPDKNNQQDKTKLFRNAIGDLTQSYGEICADKGVYAELPKTKRQEHAFWEAMCKGHLYSAEDIKIMAFMNYLGFNPINLDYKRDLIDGAARLLTKLTLSCDDERDKWVDRFGDTVFPKYHEYAPLLKISWKKSRQ